MGSTIRARALNLLHAGWNWLIPAAVRADEEQLRHAHRVLAFSAAMMVWVPVFAGVYAHFQAYRCVAILEIAGALLVCVPLVQKLSGSPTLAGNSMSLLAFSIYTWLGVNAGGHGSPPLTWYVSVPVIAVSLTGVRWGAFWAFASVAATAAFYAARQTGYRFPAELSPEDFAFVQVAGLSALIVCIFVLTLTFKMLESQAQTALVGALRRSKAADRSKSEFLANMSHEIRTPMTAILGYADLLLDEVRQSGKFKDSEIAHLRTIQSNGEHLLQIINDILDLSKIEAGKMETENIPCSPRRIVAEAMALLRSRAEAKGLAFEDRFADHVPETILSDPTRIRQILLNLLGNAVKFTERGSVSLTARCVAGPNGRKLEFVVTDTGIGMSAEHASRAFACFHQADSSTTRRFGGTGLGLAISKRLVEMLGGEISLESRLGSGSTLTVRLPLAPLHLAELPCSIPQRARSSEPAADRRLDCRILLAEDGPDNQRLISHVLTKAGAEVVVADNGQAALELALQRQTVGAPFDVILMDMQMPVLSGYEAARRLREHGYEYPIIALTAHSTASDRQECLEAGCDDYAAKPLDRSALFAAIDRQLSRPKDGDGRGVTRR